MDNHCFTVGNSDFDSVYIPCAMPKMTLMQKLVDKLNLVSRENIEGMLVTRAFNSAEF